MRPPPPSSRPGGLPPAEGREERSAPGMGAPPPSHPTDDARAGEKDPRYVLF